MKVYVGQYATGILKGQMVVDDRPPTERDWDDLFVTLAEFDIGDVEPLKGDALAALCAEQNREKLQKRADEQRAKLEKNIAELESMKASFDNKALFVV